MKQNWIVLFDEVKAKGNFVSDAEFAAHLGVSRAHISAWRRGKTDLGVITKLRVLDALGRESLHSAVSSLLFDLDPESGQSQQDALISRLGPRPLDTDIELDPGNTGKTNARSRAPSEPGRRRTIARAAGVQNPAASGERLNVPIKLVRV